MRRGVLRGLLNVLRMVCSVLVNGGGIHGNPEWEERKVEAKLGDGECKW